MRRAGMTMVEVLIALAVLSALMAVMASWTKIACTLGVTTGRSSEMRRSVETVFRCLREDLLVGDFRTRDGTDEPRVVADGHTLLIMTRTPVRGSTERRYEYEPHAGRLVVEESGPDTMGRRGIATGITGFECAIDETQSWLAVSIASADGRAHTQRYRLP